MSTMSGHPETRILLVVAAAALTIPRGTRRRLIHKG
jgi:hypothetical protein